MTLLGYYVGLSLVAFLVYASDKGSAMKGRRRVPERTLHGLGLLGGWPGAMLARTLFRHKTAKTRFVAIFWVTVLANIAAVAAVSILLEQAGR